jgi:hypothetical protein
MKHVATLAACLALLAVACGDGNRGVRVLHLSGVDMTEAEFRQLLDMAFTEKDPLVASVHTSEVVAALVSELCTLRSVEELIRFSSYGELGGEKDDGYGAFPRGGSAASSVSRGLGQPRPGQKAELESKVRAFEIVQEWCAAR